MLRGSLRHLMARVPESADIQPHLCWRRERQNGRTCRDSSARSANDRLGTAKAVTRATKPLQIGHFVPAGGSHPAMHRRARNQNKSPANSANHGARGTRTPDLLGAIHPLCLPDPADQSAICSVFDRPLGGPSGPDRRRWSLIGVESGTLGDECLNGAPADVALRGELGRARRRGPDRTRRANSALVMRLHVICVCRSSVRLTGASRPQLSQSRIRVAETRWAACVGAVCAWVRGGRCGVW
jgi:hypothetical protein